MHVQEKKKIDKVMTGISREVEVLVGQLRRLETDLEVLSQQSERFDFTTTRENISVRLDDIATRWKEADRDYWIMKENGIPCVHDGAEVIIEIRRRCQSLLRSIYQLQNDIIDEFTEIRTITSLLRPFRQSYIH